VANMAACMCKGKGMSLRTPIVTMPHNRLRQPLQTPKPVLFRATYTTEKKTT